MADKNTDIWQTNDRGAFNGRSTTRRFEGIVHLKCPFRQKKMILKNGDDDNDEIKILDADPQSPPESSR